MLRPCKSERININKIRRSHLKGEESPFYTDGISNFIYYRRSLKDKYKECSECCKDLTNAGRYEWVVHHIDHNRKNNNLSNFTILCKRCHQLEHECHKAFPKSYDKVCDICSVEFKGTASNAKYCTSCKPIYNKLRHNKSIEEIKQIILQGKV